MTTGSSTGTPLEPSKQAPRSGRCGVVLGMATALALAGWATALRVSFEERDATNAEKSAGVLPLALFPGRAPQDLGPGEYLFLPVRHSIWAINRSEGRFARYAFEDATSKLVRRSRVVTLDRRTFPSEITEYLVSDRNLTEDLWVCNRRTGTVVLWETRHDGDLLPRESGRDIGLGSYEFLPSRYTLWIVDRAKGSLEYLLFRRDQDRSVVHSERVHYRLVDFPPRDVDLRLSERNYAEVVWLCNRRTGDVQIWQPSPTGDGIRLTGTFTSGL